MSDSNPNKQCVRNSNTQNEAMCSKMTCKGLSGKECTNLSVYKVSRKDGDGDSLVLVFLVLKAGGMSSLVFPVFARRSLGGPADCIV